ncbi:OmpH family outer membrane protein [Microbulbifer sp. CAU 1566]|uniref:OmpH family outer membrane protein n=1 Tax=unclassified Microbulbifer TaxID=2619833 RepID=UPI00135B1F91|nr:OmpH family outer membrane protein [Microbulbifer sp. ALW1]MCK7595680.1 OmpH family outer membrane protein [Microbulbifer sp. CAU 1566]
MFKLVKTSAILLAGLLFTGAAVAQTKVAVVNIQAAIMSTEKATSKINALKTSSEYSQLQNSAEGIRAEVQKMAEDAQKNGVTWSDEQKAEQQRKMNFKRSDFETAVKKLRAMEGQAVQEIQKDLLPKAKAALEAVIKEKKLDLVLDANAAVYAGTGANLTEEVVKRLNAAK